MIRYLNTFWSPERRMSWTARTQEVLLDQQAWTTPDTSSRVLRTRIYAQGDSAPFLPRRDPVTLRLVTQPLRAMLGLKNVSTEAIGVLVKQVGISGPANPLSCK